jgi:hypothetical protein
MSLFGSISFLLVVSAFGCSSGAPTGIEENQAFSAEMGQVRFRVETVAIGLQVPWDSHGCRRAKCCSPSVPAGFGCSSAKN